MEGANEDDEGETLREATKSAGGVKKPRDQRNLKRRPVNQQHI
jgi:protein involved in polysaccharide export with SLBB domain